jgi:hypothetical protein
MISSAMGRPSTSALVQPKVRSAAGLNSMIRPPESIAMMQSSAASMIASRSSFSLARFFSLSLGSGAGSAWTWAKPQEHHYHRT